MFLGKAADHGVQALAHGMAKTLPWPEQVLRGLETQAIGWAVWESRHRAHLDRALEALQQVGIEPIIFKGTALAYAWYAEPHLRTRADTDLLIPASRRRDAARALLAIGMDQKGSVEPEYVSYEASFQRAEAGALHSLDVHWRIHYSQMQAKLLSYEWLHARSEPGVRFAGRVRVPRRAVACLVTCLHRANDLRYPMWNEARASFGADRLIWLYDIHLLLNGMPDEDAFEMEQALVQTGLRSIWGEAVECARAAFGTPLHPRIADLLRQDGRSDPVRRYHSHSPWVQKWTDFTSLPGAARKFAFLHEHLLPPADYMHRRFPHDAGPLPLLRMRRLLQGAVRRAPQAHPS